MIYLAHLIFCIFHYYQIRPIRHAECLVKYLLTSSGRIYPTPMVFIKHSAKAYLRTGKAACSTIIKELASTAASRFVMEYFTVDCYHYFASLNWSNVILPPQTSELVSISAPSVNIFAIIHLFLIVS